MKKAVIKWGKNYEKWMRTNQEELKDVAAMENFLDTYLNSEKEYGEADFEADLEAQLALLDLARQIKRRNNEKK